MTVIKNRPIIVENITFPTKIDSNFEESIDSQKDNVINKDSKYDERIDDTKVWHDIDLNDSSSESMPIFFIIQHLSWNLCE